MADGPPLEPTQNSSLDTASTSSSAGLSAASLEAVQLEKPLSQPNMEPEVIVVTRRGNPWLWWTFIALTLLLIVGGAIYITKGRQGQRSQLEAGHFGTITLPLKQLQVSNTASSTAQKLQVNGQLQVAGSVLLNPSAQPSNPQSGQIYFDKTSSHLNYYDGHQFQEVGNGSSVTNVTNITNVLTGSGTGVRLQAASPGTPQIGNFNVSGTGVVGTLQTTVISSNGGTLYINPVGAAAQQQVVAGTPATVGLNVAGSITTPTGWNNTLSATKVTLTDTGGIANSIAVYFDSAAPGSHIQVGLYSDDGDIPSKPDALLAASSSVIMNANGFTTVPIPTVNLSANATYWLVVNTDSTTAVRTYNGNNKISCFVSSIYGFMPDPFSPFGCFSDNNQYAIYLNYSLGAGVSGSLSQASVALGPTGQVLFQNSTDSNTAFQVQNAAGTSTILDIDTIKGNVGIGKATPSYKLDIAAGDINLSNGHSLRFGGLQAISVNGPGTTTSITNFIPSGKVSVQADGFVVQDADAIHQKLSIDSTGAAIFSNRVDSTTGFQIQNAANTSTILNVDTTNKIVTVSNLVSTGNITVNGHIITGGSTPAIAAGTAACTTPTVSINGTDTSGTITVTTGTGCAASGTLGTITFSSVFGAAPHVVVSPGSSTALTLGAYIDDATATTTSFVLATNSTPSNSTTYRWNYVVLQ